MEKSEAKTTVKAIYLQAAALAGFEVSPESPEKLVELVERGFASVEPNRKAEAVANVLRLLATTLELAGERGDTLLHETSVDAAHNKVCPVYPFGTKSKPATAKKGSKATKKRSR